MTGVQTCALPICFPVTIAAAEVDGIDVKELTTGSKRLSPSDHEPELLSFEFDQNLKAVDTLLSMLPYDELPEFEQDNIDKYQRYIFAKAAKDTGKSVQDFSLQEHGALESEQAGNRYYVYKFDNGTDCEIHLVSIDLNTGDYRDWETDRKSTRLNSSHLKLSRMPSSA